MISVVIANLLNDDPCYVSVCSRDRTITSSSNYVYPTRFRANVSTYGDTGLIWQLFSAWYHNQLPNQAI